MKKRLFAFIMLVSLVIVNSCLLCTPPVNAAVSDIDILSYSWYVSPANSFTSAYGDLVVVGEVENKGSSTIDYVTLDCVAFTSDGQAAASLSYSAFGANLHPGQKAPFYLDFSYLTSFTGNTSWVSSFDHIALNVIRAEATEAVQNQGLAVAAQTSYTDSNGVFTVAGIIQNNGTEVAGKVWVVTTFYNSSGGVVATNYTDYLTSTLSPGGAVQFTATPIDNTVLLSSKIATYSLMVQSKEPEVVASPSPSSSASPSVSASPSISAGSTTPPAASSESSNTLVYVAAIAAVAVVVVALALVLRRRKK